MTLVILEGPCDVILLVILEFHPLIKFGYQCASQPAILGIANRITNMSVGNPSAL